MRYLIFVAVLIMAIFNAEACQIAGLPPLLGEYHHLRASLITAGFKPVFQPTRQIREQIGDTGDHALGYLEVCDRGQHGNLYRWRGKYGQFTIDGSGMKWRAHCEPCPSP